MDDNLIETLEELQSSYIDEALGVQEFDLSEETTKEEPIDLAEPVEQRYRPSQVKNIEHFLKRKHEEEDRLNNLSPEKKQQYLFNKAKSHGNNLNYWASAIKGLI